MYEYDYDFGDDYESNEYILEVNEYDVAEALLDMYHKNTLRDTIKNLLSNIDFESYLENNGDVPCTIDEYLKEAWDGTYKDFVNNFNIDFIEDELHMELHDYFLKRAMAERRFYN